MTSHWNKRVWRIAGPIILSNISVPLLGLVDTAVVGRLPGPSYIGAVAIGAMIFNVLYWAFGFLRMGTTGFTAQAIGRDDFDDCRNILGRAFIIALMISAGLLLLQVPLKSLAFQIVDASPSVLMLSDTYFDIRIWAAPAALLNYALLGWFIGAEDTKSALISQVFLNGLNMVLDIIFVLHLDWGVDGVAYATVIAEYSALGLALLLMKKRAARLGGQWQPTAWFNLQAQIAMMTVNRDIFIRTLCLQAVFVSFTAVGARLGDVQLAANAVLLLFQSIMAYGLDGFAFAAETLTGQAYGARRKQDFHEAVRAGTRFAVALSVLTALVYWLFGPMVIDFITKDAAVQQSARIFLIWTIISPIISVWSFMLDGIFIGCTRSREMRNAMAISLVFYLCLLAVTLPAFGNHGLWFAFLAFMAMRAMTLRLYYGRILKHFG